MRSGKDILYWDACIWLAWLKDETCEPGVMEGIEEIVKRVAQNQAILITSVMTQTEVLEGRLDKQAVRLFDSMFKSRNVEYVNHDSRVGTLSHFIRDYYDQRNIKLSSPDSVHLASAILYKASVFYTLDGSGKKKRGMLLPLDGNVAGYKLKIKKPFDSQLSLKLEPEPPKGKSSGKKGT